MSTKEGYGRKTADCKKSEAKCKFHSPLDKFSDSIYQGDNSSSILSTTCKSVGWLGSVFVYVVIWLIIGFSGIVRSSLPQSSWQYQCFCETLRTLIGHFSACDSGPSVWQHAPSELISVQRAYAGFRSGPGPSDCDP